MSPDPYPGSYDFSNPQSLNRYSYVMNNPLTFTDTAGLDGHGCEEAPPLGSGLSCFVSGVQVVGGEQASVDLNSQQEQNSSGQSTSNGQSSDQGQGALYQFEVYANLFTIGPTEGPDSSSTRKPTPQSAAPNNAVPKNPCAYGGRALPPSAYAIAGQQAKGSPINFTLDVTMGWPKGDYLDAQPLTGAPTAQAAAYGNYVFGIYMQAAGVTLSETLSGANAYAFLRSRYPAGTPMDPNYSSLPAANVANITNGFNAQAAGTTCHF